MSSGAIFTSLVSFCVFASALGVGISFFRQRKRIDEIFFPYALFLFTTAGLWFFVGLSLFFSWLEMKSLSRVSFLIDQIFVFASGPFLAWYFFLKLTRNKNLTRAVVVIFIVICLAGTFFLLEGGIIEGDATYFAFKYRPNEIAFLIFAFLLAPLFALAFLDIFFGFTRWVAKKKRNEFPLFLYSLGLFVYLLLGYFDEQGFIAGWKLVVFRTFFIAVYLYIYLLFRHHFPRTEGVLIDSGETEREGSLFYGSIAFKRTIFRKILIILILLSLLPAAFSAFLAIATYQGALTDLGKGAAINLPELRQNILIQVFLILFLLVVLVFFTTVLVARGITRPISDFVRGVNEVSRGNLDIRFKVKSKNELGQLALAFNEMIVKLKEQREREKLVARLKTEFTSIAAHQLRTPLSTIKWILRMLLDGDFGALSLKQKEFAEKGYEANDRMIHLVNDLLDVTRIEEGRYGFEFGWHDFNEFLKDVADSMEGDARLRKIEFTSSFEKGSLFLFFDPERLRMAVSNLISNAIRYTEPGGRVSVSCVKKDNVVEVVIKDTGVGIPERQKDRIFTKFFRGDNVVRMQTEGTGLGLYLAKNIVEKHGGSIWFESKEGKGTAFYFILPIGAFSPVEGGEKGKGK